MSGTAQRELVIMNFLSCIRSGRALTTRSLSYDQNFKAIRQE